MATSSAQKRRGSASPAPDSTRTSPAATSDIATTGSALPRAVQYLPHLLSLTAIPVMYALNTWRELKENETFLFAVATAICCAIYFIPRVFLPKGMPSPPAPFFVFTFFAFACVVDLVLSLSAAHVIDWGRFYLDEGERYLDTSHGAFINGWDTTAHWSFYVWAGRQYLLHGNKAACEAPSSPFFRGFGLWWAGSIINSLLVLLPGIAVGEWVVKPSAFLNAPFILFPIFYALHLLSLIPRPSSAALRDGHSTSFSTALATLRAFGSPDASSASHPSVSDAALAVFSPVIAAALLGVAVLRGFVVGGAKTATLFIEWGTEEAYLNSPMGFPKAQTLVTAYYIAPALLAITMAVASAGSTRSALARFPLLAGFACFVAGAAAQAQMSYLGGMLCGTACGATPGWTAPNYGSTIVRVSLVSHVALAVFPQVLAWRLYDAAEKAATKEDGVVMGGRKKGE